LKGVCDGFVEACIKARCAAFRAPGTRFTVARTTGCRHAVQVAHFQVIDGVLDAWVR